MPNPAGYTMADATSVYDTPRGPVPYPDKFDMMASLGVGTVDPEMAPGNWLAENPHRLDLGRVGLLLRSQPGATPETDPAVLTAVHQHLDLWTGTIHSRFTYVGEAVEAHPPQRTPSSRGRLPHSLTPPVRRASGGGIALPVRERQLLPHHRLDVVRSATRRP